MPIDLKQSERIRTGFSEWAPSYDDDTQGPMQWAAPRQLATMLRPHLHEGDLVFDLGCGTGQAPLHLPDPPLQWTGVDLCTAMLRQARERGLYQSVRRMNVERKRYPFPGETFDAVLSSGVLEFTGQIDSVLREICRVLKIGGYLAFSVELPPRGMDVDVLDSDEYYYVRYRYSEALVRRFLQQANLAHVHTERLKAYKCDEGWFVRYACFLARRD